MSFASYSTKRGCSVPSSRRGIALQILDLLSKTNFPGLTRGEIRTALDLPEDTEITARVRELRDHVSYGNFDIRKECISKTVVRYYMLDDERRRAKIFLAVRTAA
jgi:hypothetical protein